MDKLLLTVKEVAYLTGVSRSKLYEDILDQPGGIPTVHIGRAVRVPKAAVEHWVERLLQDSDRAA